MPEYRYYSIDPRTGTPTMDLPLYGTFMDKVFSGNGNFQGTYRLGSEIGINELLINGTIPAKHGLVCTRDNVIVWAGMIWSRTYAAESQTVQLTGQTFESIFAKIPILTIFQDLTGTIDESVLWNIMLDNMQAHLSGEHNFNLLFSTPGSTGNVRLVDYLPSEWKMYQAIVDQLSSYSNGYGYTINIGAGSNDSITKTFQLVRNDTSLAPSSGLAFDYPGTISNYWYSESSNQAGTIMVGLADQLRVGATLGSASYNAGSPTYDIDWYYAETIQDTQGDSDLQARTNGLAREHGLPQIKPTFELGSQSNFTGWNSLGTTFNVYIDAQDPRFPNGTTVTERLMGWSLTPESQGQPEVIRFVLDGD